MEPQPTSAAPPPAAPAPGLGTMLLATLCAHVLVLQPYPYDNISSRLALTFAVVDEGVLNVDSFASTTLDKSFFNGHFFLDKAPGPSLALVPVLFLFRLLCRVTSLEFPLLLFRLVGDLCVMGVPTALVAWVLWRTVAGWSGSNRTAFVATVGWVLGSPALAYGTSLYGHQWAAASLVCGWWMLLSQREDAPWWHAALAGFVATLAWWGDYPAILFSALILGGVLLQRRMKLPVWFSVAAGAAVPVLGIMAYNHVCFGSAWSMSYAHKHNPDFAAIHSQGVYGLGLPSLGNAWLLLFSLHKGLFVWAPWLLFAAAGLGHMLWKGGTPRHNAAIPAAVVVLMALLFCGFGDPEAGWTLGPRHMVPMLPFLAMGLAGLGSLRPSAVTSVLLAAWGASLLMNVTATLTTMHIPLGVDHIWRDALFPLIQEGYSSNTLVVLAQWPLLLASVAAAGMLLGGIFLLHQRHVGPLHANTAALLAGGSVAWLLIFQGIPWLLLPVSTLKPLAVGRHLLPVGSYDAANRWLAQASTVAESRQEALELRADALLHLGRPQDAAHVWLETGRPDLALHAALILWRTGARQEAIQALAPHAAQPDATVLRAAMMQQSGDVDGARALLATPAAQQVPQARRQELEHAVQLQPAP